MAIMAAKFILSFLLIFSLVCFAGGVYIFWWQDFTRVNALFAAALFAVAFMVKISPNDGEVPEGYKSFTTFYNFILGILCASALLGFFLTSFGML